MPKRLPEPLVLRARTSVIEDGRGIGPRIHDDDRAAVVRWEKTVGPKWTTLVIAPLPRALKPGETVEVRIVGAPAKKRRAKR